SRRRGDDPSVGCAGREYAFILCVRGDAKGVVPGNVAKTVFDHLIFAHIEANLYVFVVHGIGAFASHNDYGGPRAISHRVIEIQRAARKPARAAIGFPTAEGLVEVVIYAFLAHRAGKAGVFISVQIETFSNRPGNAYQTGIGR